MLMMLWQAATETAATVAGAANAAADRWTAEQWRDLIVGVIGALVAGFIAWQNAYLKRQNDEIILQNVVHEENANVRAAQRGDVPADLTQFPGAKH